jgi:hypothetical protein
MLPGARAPKSFPLFAILAMCKNQWTPNIDGQPLCCIYLWLHHAKKVEAYTSWQVGTSDLQLPPVRSKTQLFLLTFLYILIRKLACCSTIKMTSIANLKWIKAQQSRSNPSCWFDSVLIGKSHFWLSFQVELSGLFSCVSSLNAAA